MEIRITFKEEDQKLYDKSMTNVLLNVARETFM